jgi:hypothetical protein
MTDGIVCARGCAVVGREAELLDRRDKEDGMAEVAGISGKEGDVVGGGGRGRDGGPAEFFPKADLAFMDDLEDAGLSLDL